MCVHYAFIQQEFHGHLPGAKLWEYNNEKDGFTFPEQGN